jgi:hypothetical protein
MPNTLHACPACGGLLPAARTVCPHCDHAVVIRPFARLAKILAQLTIGAGLAVTLMACYGVGPRYGHDGYAQERCVDADADGVCVEQDCNDNDPSIVPGGGDLDGDGVDQNCDGVDGWRDPAAVAAPAAEPAAPEPTPIATDPAPPPSP